MRSEVAWPGVQAGSTWFRTLPRVVVRRQRSRPIICSLPYLTDDLDMLSVLITGCSEGGIGFELAREFHRRGASKVVHSTSPSHVYSTKGTRS